MDIPVIRNSSSRPSSPRYTAVRSTKTAPVLKSSVEGERNIISESIGNYIKIELPVIDLGRIDIGEKKECYFTATNSHPTESIVFTIIPPVPLGDFRFPFITGHLTPLETKRFYLQIIPSSLGRKSLSFDIHCFKSVSKVTFNFYCILSSYLSFPNLETTSLNALPEIDFGPCYIDSSKKFAKIFEL
jgi:hypothetical protein